MNHPLLRSSTNRGARARVRGAGALLWVALALLLPLRAVAATLVVNGASDVAATDGVCTLREAIENANANAATYVDCAAGQVAPTVDHIQFSGVSSITLSGVELPVSESVAIDGPVTIDGGGVGRSARILHATAGTVTAHDVTFQNAVAAGGAAILAASASLDLTDCTFDHNTASSSAGGAVSTTAGDVTLTRATFTDNAASAGDGGALWVSLTNNTLAVTDGVFTDNSATNAGGALYVAGTGTGGATITGTSFLGNSCTNTSASKGGGAIYDAVASSSGTAISLSSFDSNVATAGQGGAIFNASSASNTVISDTLFESNQAPGPGVSQGFGGAIHNVGHLAVVTSSLHGNSAARSGAAISNRAAGTITVTVANSTIAGNTAGLSGGGIWNLAGSKIETRNATIASNTIVSTSYGGANVWNDGAFAVLNTILADGIGTTGCGPTGLTNNLGDGNLQYPAATCTAGPAAIPAGDPKLGTPTHDGGPAGLLVMPLGAGSAAIGAANAATCSAAPISSLDQRGVARPLPVATTCDAGAYESGRIAAFSSSPVAGSTVPITVYAGSTDSGKVTVSETGTDDLIVSAVGVSGDSEITLASATSFTVADGGAAADVTVECSSAQVGVYTSTLSISHNGGASPSTYTVSCQVVPAPAPIYASNPSGGSSLDLATVAGTPDTKDVVVSNTGNATLHVSAVSVTGDAEISLTTAGSFQIVNGGPDETVTVQCSAVNGGSYSATLSVTHDADGSPVTYPVTCEVTEPGFSSSPAPGATLELSTLAGTPTSADVVVSETGDATLTVSSVAVTGDAELALSTASSFSIADGAASVTVTVECSAAVPGTYTGTLTITHDADGGPASYAVSCDVAPVPVQGYSSVPSSGSTLNLGTVAGTPTTTDVVVSETGNTALVVGSVSVSGDAALTLVTPGSFSIADGGGSETITVQCSSAQVGTYTGSLTVVHGGPSSPEVYPISCNVTAVPAPGFSSDPAPDSTVPLVTVAGTPQSSNIVVSETGNLPLIVSDVSLSGDPEIALLTPTSFTIADGDPAQAVSVQCDAVNPGDYSATLTITHNAAAPGGPIHQLLPHATYTIDCTVTPSAAPGYGSEPAAGATIPMVTGRGIPADEHITVSDTGNAELAVSDIDVDGDPAITLTSATSFVLDYRAPTHDITFRCSSAVAGSYSAVITVHHNAGAAAQYAVSCSVGGVAGDTRGDFDGDGHPDLVWEDQRDGALSVWLMDGAQRLAQRPLDPAHTPGASWHVKGSSDFNGDAKADLLLQNASTGAMKVWFMNGLHKFGEADVTPSSINDAKQVVVAVADLNGDGRPDVVRQVPGKMPMNVLFLKGASVLGQTSINPDKATKTSAKILGAPDLNGDGKADFLFANKGQLTVWFMDGVTRTATASLDPSAAPTTKDMLVGNADFNGDGKTDLLFENRKSGALVLWTMNGIHRLNAVPTAPAKEVDPNLVIAAPR